MKIQLPRFGGIPILLSLAALALSAAVAQISDIPPVKMGLWQTEVTTTMAGMENMPMAHAMGNHSSTTQSCMTPETWKSDLQKLNDSQHKSDCNVTNMHLDTHGMTFDETCTTPNGGNSTIHFEAQFDGNDHMHGTAKMQMSGKGMPQGMTMNMTMTSHYVGADCGDVKPGSAKIIH